MRRLMLLRHAKSDWSAPGQRDIDRPLSSRGRDSAAVMGRYMAQHGLVPDRVLVSSARRTRETWELLAPAFDRQPAFAYEPGMYEASPARLLEIIRTADRAIHSLMLIGHNPGMQEVAAMLVATGDVHARQQLHEKFPAGALAVLDFATDDWQTLRPNAGRLDRFVLPRALQTESE
jgi:phosphohistidine phosphatase